MCSWYGALRNLVSRHRSGLVRVGVRVRDRVRDRVRVRDWVRVRDRVWVLAGDAREEAVRLAQRVEGGLREVAARLGVALRRGVAIGYAGHLQHLLRGGRRHDASTTRGGHQANTHGATLARQLDGHLVRVRVRVRVSVRVRI